MSYDDSFSPPKINIILNPYGGLHIIPVDDTVKHQESRRCWCEPKIIDGVVVHNSFDGREDFENIVEVKDGQG